MMTLAINLNPIFDHGRPQDCFPTGKYFREENFQIHGMRNSKGAENKTA